MKEKAIVVDIDGCLLDVSLLYKEASSKQVTDEAFWSFFHENANNSEYSVKIQHIFDLVNFYENAGYKIIILTARRDLIGPATLNYLLSGAIKLNNVTMMVCRTEEMEGMPSHLYKKQEIQKLSNLYQIDLIIDDEYANCAIFRELGFTVLRVIRKELADV